MPVCWRFSLPRVAIAATGAMLLHGAASAQTVQVFDEVPSIEQLRSIMIPESHAGTSRSIVIQRPGTGGPALNMQRASTRVLPAQRPRVATNATSSPGRDQPSAPVSDQAAEPGAVAFRVNFAFNSTQLPGAARAMIELMAQLMKEAPEIKVRVEGHTDATGSPEYNASLSERRALSVGVYLEKQGVEPSRLLLIGKGMAEPLTQNGYDSVNRRVQFVRVG